MIGGSIAADSGEGDRKIDWDDTQAGVVRSAAPSVVSPNATIDLNKLNLLREAFDEADTDGGRSHFLGVFDGRMSVDVDCRRRLGYGRIRKGFWKGVGVNSVSPR